MNVAFAVDVPPALLKNSTSIDVLPFVPALAMVSEPTLEFVGSVTPSEDIDTVPVPSEEIVAPPKSIVCPARNNSLNLLDEEPRFLTLVWSGIISSVTLPKLREPKVSSCKLIKPPASVPS